MWASPTYRCPRSHKGVAVQGNIHRVREGGSSKRDKALGARNWRVGGWGRGPESFWVTDAKRLPRLSSLQRKMSGGCKVRQAMDFGGCWPSVTYKRVTSVEWWSQRNTMN